MNSDSNNESIYSPWLAELTIKQIENVNVFADIRVRNSQEALLIELYARFVPTTAEGYSEGDYKSLFKSLKYFLQDKLHEVTDVMDISGVDDRRDGSNE